MTHFINGEWQPGSAETLSKHNPVSGEILWQGNAASAAQVAAATRPVVKTPAAK